MWENLKIGFFVLFYKECKVFDEIFELFLVLYKMLKWRGGDLFGG